MMVVETSSHNQYQFTYVWTIYDFVLCPQLQGSAIISQTFVVYELGGTSWRLYLYPRGKTNPDYVLVYLYRESNGCWKNQVVVDLKISIENGEGVQISCKLANNVLFEENDIWKGIQFLKREKLMWFLKNSNSNTLILSCEMSVNIATDICKWSEYTDLKALSDDLLNLHKGEVFTDTRLRCEDATINTHKCILAARLSQLSLQSELSDTKHELEKINAALIPTSLMKILLCYAYSGKLDLPLSEIPADLYSIASRFRITDLIQKLKSYPKLCYYYTFLNVKQSCFVWRLKKRNVTEGNSTCLIRIVPTESLYVDNVNVSCTIKTNLKDNFVEDINIAFYIDDIQENIPILLFCNVFATTSSNYLIGCRQRNHVFKNNSVWRISMQCNEIPFGDYLDVTCEMSLCDGVTSSKVRESVMLHNDIPRYHDFSALSSDMFRLLASRAYSDFTIVVGDHAFDVHTAVLVARSPVFSKMLQHDMVEKETRRVVIRDVRPVIVQLMLLYMYTGTVRGLEFNEAIDLYEAADKYFVDVLKKRCAHLLLSIAKEDNLCLLFDLADKHSDVDLKNRVYEIIHSNNCKNCGQNIAEQLINVVFNC